MAVLVDTSVIIDYLRGHHGAQEVLEEARLTAPLHASEMTRLEVLAGMRANEEGGTRLLLSLFQWHPVDTMIAELAGELGRQWLPAHRSIDGADLAIANLNKVNSRDTHTRCGSTFGDPAPSANDC